MKPSTENLLNEIKSQFSSVSEHREARYRDLVAAIVAGVDDDAFKLIALDAVAVVEASGRSFVELERDVSSGSVITIPAFAGQLRVGE